jgi:membrane protein required for beta-lactamase induction
MTLICLLIAFALEFHFKLGSEFRKFAWFESLRTFLEEQFSDKAFFDSWGGIALIILTPILVLWAGTSVFDGMLYWLLLFIISTVVLFICLGPSPLEKSFKPYFDSMENDDIEGGYLHIKELKESGEISSDDGVVLKEDDTDAVTSEGESIEKDELIRSVTRLILTESQKRYFGVIAWFIFLGPLGALLFRLSHLYFEHCKKERFDDHLPLMKQVIHWIDWVPARITSLLFLLTGDFVNGFYRIQDYLADASADNEQLISETGIAALGIELGVNDDDVAENLKTQDMVQRTVIFYLVVGAIITMVL